MSNIVSALPVDPAEGFATIREMGPQGMVTIRGDLANAKFKKAVKDAAGHPVPDQRAIAGGLGGGLAWMSPDELMLFCDYPQAEAKTSEIGAALSGTHHLAVNVSDARAVFAIEGAAAREVIAKLCPVDMAPGQFEPGMIRRSRMAQVPAAFWMPEPEAIHLVCFRSVAQYVFDLLKTSAETGSETGVY